MRLTLPFQYPEQGQKANKVLVLEREQIYIGRISELAPFLDRSCSRNHAIIYETMDGRILIRDLQSRNGTFLNGGKISQCVLKIGDTLSIGKLHIHVVDAHTGVSELWLRGWPEMWGSLPQTNQVSKPRTGTL